MQSESEDKFYMDFKEKEHIGNKPHNQGKISTALHRQKERRGKSVSDRNNREKSTG
jgi:hypothetical protein